MPTVINGYTLNDVNEPANWSTVERAYLAALAALMPPAGTKDTTTEHLHDRVGFSGATAHILAAAGSVKVNPGKTDIDTIISASGYDVLRVDGGDKTLSMYTNRKLTFGDNSTTPDGAIWSDGTTLNITGKDTFSISVNPTHDDVDLVIGGSTSAIASFDAGEEVLHLYDTKKLTFGGTAASPDASIHSDGTDLFIEAPGAGNLYINSNLTDCDITIGAVGGYWGILDAGERALFILDDARLLVGQSPSNPDGYWYVDGATSIGHFNPAIPGSITPVAIGEQYYDESGYVKIRLT